MPRQIDHCVLPVGDLGASRARLSALGFTVAPDGIHPFGTANSCVFFVDDTFLEPLAVADQNAYEDAVHNGNVFIQRDLAFRSGHRKDGFSALVFKTGSAESDHAFFFDADISAGSMLAFARPAIDLSGKKDTAEFKLAFAADTWSPDVFFFSCQRVRSPKVDRSALQVHANGAMGMASIIISARCPSEHTHFLETLTSAGADGSEPKNLRFQLGNTSIRVVDSQRFRADFAAEVGEGRGLKLRAIVFSVGDLGRTQKILENNAIDVRSVAGRLVVQTAPGQGAIFAFQQNRDTR